MKLKNMWKRFWTLDVHNHEGFTLVELIIVIAILAILSTGAIAGYSAYIKRANLAMDQQLLSEINLSFRSACIDNLCDAYDIEIASWDMEEMTVASVEGSNSHPIITSFATYFNSEAAVAAGGFKVYTAILFENGAFVGYTEEELMAAGGAYADIFKNLDLEALISLFQGSAFNDLGSEELMNRVDIVTNLVADIMTTSPNAGQALKEALSTEETMQNLATYLGFSSVEELSSHIASQDDPDAYYNKLLSNYAVLEVAGTTANKSADEMLAELQVGVNVDEIKALLGSQNAGESSAAMGKAASMYAMYTAYASTLTGDAKAAAQVNLNNMGTFASSLTELTTDDPNNDNDFYDYLNSAQAVADMEGYISAMGIINQSKENDADGAVGNLLENGYTDPELLAALQGLLGS